MTESRPQHPPRPAHLSFLPWAGGMAFLVLVVVVGVIASNSARDSGAGSVVTVCDSESFIAAARANSAVAGSISSGQLSLGQLTVPRYKCLGAWAFVTYQPGEGRPPVDAWLQESGQGWKIRGLGADAGDGVNVGVPRDVSEQLRAQ